MLFFLLQLLWKDVFGDVFGDVLGDVLGDVFGDVFCDAFGDRNVEVMACFCVHGLLEWQSTSVNV